MSQYLNRHDTEATAPIATSLVVQLEPLGEVREMALLALSHTASEHRLYLKMQDSLRRTGASAGFFSVRQLMRMTGFASNSSVRRACLGLIEKLSVETGIDIEAPNRPPFRVFEPGEIFHRRAAAGKPPYPEEIADLRQSHVFRLIAETVVNCPDISRREAFVALLCAEGLSNAAIGHRLSIDEKTVKYHLRNIFIKLGVSRRAELLGRLLRERDSGAARK